MPSIAFNLWVCSFSREALTTSSITMESSATWKWPCWGFLKNRTNKRRKLFRFFLSAGHTTKRSPGLREAMYARVASGKATAMTPESPLMTVCAVRVMIKRTVNKTEWWTSDEHHGLVTWTPIKVRRNEMTGKVPNGCLAGDRSWFLDSEVFMWLDRLSYTIILLLPLLLLYYLPVHL